MFVACGAQSGANSNENTENQNAEVDILKEVDKASAEDVMIAKYGKVAYRMVYTYGDGHSEHRYIYKDNDRYVLEEGYYTDIVEDGKVYGLDNGMVFNCIFVDDCFEEYAEMYSPAKGFYYVGDIEKVESQEEKNDILTVVTSIEDAATLKQWETDAQFEEGSFTKLEHIYEIEAKTYELLTIKVYAVQKDGTKINVHGVDRVTDLETYVVDEEITKIINSEDKRTVTVIAHPGTDQERTYSASIGKGNPIYVYTPLDGDQTLYIDAECTIVHEDGSDPNKDLTLYYK